MKQCKEAPNSEQTPNNDFVKSSNNYSSFYTKVIDIVRSSKTPEQFTIYLNRNSIKYLSITCMKKTSRYFEGRGVRAIL
jgi:hypothetical protein